MTTLERLIASWQASSKLHSFRRGATAFEIKFFETSAGWKLPTEWREFYAFANGADLFDGEVLGGGWVQIRPLLGVASLLDGPQYWRDRYHWPVPDELWIAAECVWCGQVLGAVTLPQSALAPESGHPTFRGDAGAGQDGYRACVERSGDHGRASPSSLSEQCERGARTVGRH